MRQSAELPGHKVISTSGVEADVLDERSYWHCSQYNGILYYVRAPFLLNLSNKSVREQLYNTGPLLKMDIFGGSFGSAVDAKNEKLLLFALSLRSVYLHVVAHLA